MLLYHTTLDCRARNSGTAFRVRKSTLHNFSSCKDTTNSSPNKIFPHFFTPHPKPSRSSVESNIVRPNSNNTHATPGQSVCFYSFSHYFGHKALLFQENKVYLQRKLSENKKSMALEIRSIPVLEGAAAERFIREAEENARNPKKSKPRFLTLSDFEQIEENTIAREQARKHG